MNLEIGNYNFTPDDRKRATARELAYLNGRQEQAEDDRLAAFGAIRRAVALARQHDKRAKELSVSSPRSAFVLSHMNEAHAIRRAIRAAIGSEER